MSHDAEYIRLRQEDKLELEQGLDEVSVRPGENRTSSKWSIRQIALIGLISAYVVGSSSYILLRTDAIPVGSQTPNGLSHQVVTLPAAAVRYGGNVSNVLDYVKGPPTFSIRDNLRPEYKYLASWDGAGMSNEVMASINVIHVAYLADRVPIVAPLFPDSLHLGSDKVSKTPLVNFGDIFDLPRARRDLNMPILEWKDVKVAAYDLPFSHETTPVEGVVQDKIGCWGWRGRETPRRSLMEPLLQLDVAMTLIPEKAIIETYHVNAWGLIDALYPPGRDMILTHRPGKHIAPTSHEWIPPDEHLACFDAFYNVEIYGAYDWFKDYVPFWRFTGRYLRFNERMDRIADEYLMKLFGVDTYAEVPPFIVLHMRRGDWDGWCFQKHPKGDVDCWAPIPIWEKHVETVKTGLKEKYGEDSVYGQTTQVIVTSDEQNVTWWDTEITSRGWLHVDFAAMNTTKVYNRWYPSLIDSVIQSRGIGFVGLYRSTMSQIAKFRVEDWNGGVASIINWRDGHGARRARGPPDSSFDFYA